MIKKEKIIGPFPVPIVRPIYNIIVRKTVIEEESMTENHQNTYMHIRYIVSKKHPKLKIER